MSNNDLVHPCACPSGVALVFCIALFGCRAPAQPAPMMPPPEAEVREAELVELSDVHARALVVHGHEILALGRQRRSAQGEGVAWVAGLDLDGRELWSATREQSPSWVEDVRISGDASYLFGRGAGGQAWLWRVDAQGASRGFMEFPTGRVLSFESRATGVDLILTRGTHPVNDAGRVDLTWLHWNNSELAPQRRDARMELGVTRIDELECEASDAEHLCCDGETWSLDDQDTETDACADIEAREVQQAHNEVVLEPGVPATLELGASALLALQQLPSTQRETRLLLTRVDAQARAAGLARLETRVRAAAETSAEPSGSWGWLEPLVDPATLSTAKQSELAQWLLRDARGCYPERVAASCGTGLVAYPLPVYRDPSDPCWRLERLLALSELSQGEALAINLDQWIELLTHTDLRPRGIHDGQQELDMDARAPAEELFDALFMSVPSETLIPAMVLNTGADSQVPLDAIAALETLDAAQAEVIATGLLSSLRDEYERCGEVLAIVEQLQSRGLAEPAWEAELDDACDILFVMCSGLQPELDELVVAPSGFDVTERCDSELPTDLESAEESGLPMCTPAREHSEWVDLRGISAQVAASCGDDEALTQLTYTCGVVSEFEVHTYEWHEDADGRVWFDGLDILHTTVE